ncbi:hypothetical protein F4782DRAFT_534541 [Xylaria castorea]|nr:hypothetical protein F4782DRAFT_534541 [Xylaria castorea]
MSVNMASPSSFSSSGDTCFSSRAALGGKKRKHEEEERCPFPSPPSQTSVDRPTSPYGDALSQVSTQAASETSESDISFDGEPSALHPDDAVERVLTVVRDRSQGLGVPDCPTFHIQGQRTYERLHHKLQEDGLKDYFDRLRKHWNAATGILTLRLMSTPLHDTLEILLSDMIKEELKNVVLRNPCLQDLASGITPCGTSKIIQWKSGKAVLEKSPDGQLRYIGKVNEYFELSRGEIGTVLGIKIGYDRPKVRATPDHSHDATLLLWSSSEPGDGEITIKRSVKMFRKDDEVMPGALELPFAWFLPLDKRDRIPPSAQDEKLRIPFESLAEALCRAEKIRQENDAPVVSSLPAKRREVLRFVEEDTGEVRKQVTLVPEAKRHKKSVTRIYGHRVYDHRHVSGVYVPAHHPPPIFTVLALNFNFNFNFNAVKITFIICQPRRTSSLTPTPLCEPGTPTPTPSIDKPTFESPILPTMSGKTRFFRLAAAVLERDAPTKDERLNCETYAKMIAETYVFLRDYIPRKLPGHTISISGGQAVMNNLLLCHMAEPYVSRHRATKDANSNFVVLKKLQKARSHLGRKPWGLYRIGEINPEHCLAKRASQAAGTSHTPASMLTPPDQRAPRDTVPRTGSAGWASPGCSIILPLAKSTEGFWAGIEDQVDSVFAPAEDRAAEVEPPRRLRYAIRHKALYRR